MKVFVVSTDIFYKMEPVVTPAKIFRGKTLPFPCTNAIIFFIPFQEEIFETSYTVRRLESTKERLFLHIHPVHVDFYLVDGINTIVISEVYGGPVIASLIEELHYYGIKNVIGVGYLGALKEFSIGDIIYCNKSLCEHGLSILYGDSDEIWINNDSSIESPFPLGKVWTTNAIYREYPEDCSKMIDLGCQVVNMDTSSFYVSCRKLGIKCDYFAIVSDILCEEYKQKLLDFEVLNRPLTQLLHYILSSLSERMEYIIMDIVRELFNECNMCNSHNIEHVLNVYTHTKKALNCDEDCDEETKHLVKIAAILHDVDDEKFFKTEDYSNARRILRNCCYSNEQIALVIEMIDYVSTSKNGDSIPPRAIDKPYLLYPRWADRVEACGKRGVRRAYQYNVGISSPLYDEETEKPATIEDVWKIATPERYLSYRGKSRSIIDHFYDKLLHVSKFPTENPYFLSLKDELDAPLLEVIQAFIEGNLTHEFMRRY